MKPAFTLIELLVVITIIGVLTSLIVFDFTGAKNRQELSIVADQTLAMLQQAHAEVASGKVRMTEDSADGEGADENVENVFLCEGAYFEVGAVPQFATADYVDGACDANTVVLKDYGLTPGEAYLGEIKIGDSSVNEVYVFFDPPDADLSFNSGAYTGDARLDFVHDKVLDLLIALEISEATGQFELVTNPDEE